MKSIKFKIIALLMAVLMFVSSPARAVEPLTICLIVSAVAHVVVGGVLWKQGVFSQSGKGAATTADGSKIGRGATVQWIDTKDIDTTGLPKAKHKDVTVKVDGQKLMDAAKANPSKYPKLSALASSSSALDVSNPSSDFSTLAVGSFVSFGGNNYQLTSKSSYQTCTPDYGSRHDTNYPYSNSTSFGDRFYQRNSTRGSCSSPNWSYTLHIMGGVPVSTSVVPVVPATKSQFAQKLAKSNAALTSPAGVYSDYYGEIDDYITGNSGSCSIVDTPDPLNVGTAPNYNMPTPATQSGVNTAIAAAGARSAAQNAVNTAQGNYDANPSAENAQRLADALRELARIIADQIREGIIDNPDGTHDEDDDDDGDGDGDDEEEDTGGFDLDPYGTQTDADLDFGTRFRDFFDQMRTTALFSLPNQFLSGLPSGGSSVMSFSAGRFGHHTFDFSLFSSLWTTLKTIILVLFAWLGVRIVTLKGGGG